MILVFAHSLTKKACTVGDCILTTGGSIICADCVNNKLTKLDSSYTVIYHLNLPDSPGSLCEVNNTEFAVTLFNGKKVQFVAQHPRVPLMLDRWFTVGDRCRGICCHDGQLYVCCGAGKNEGPGHIEVYDIDGDLLRTFYECLSFPFCIKPANDGELFLMDFRSSGNRMLKINTSHFSLSEIQMTDMTGADSAR